MVRWVLVWLVFYNFKILASGAWYQESQQIPKRGNSDFSPEFVILKSGVFSNQGKLTLDPKITEKNLVSLCSRGIESIAWITHRLSPNQTLSSESGKTLGVEISKKLSGTCFSSVELDIEPLKKAEPWLEAFLTALKTSLKPETKLRLAVPVLSPQTIQGNFWSLEDGVKALRWVDGLDVMAYDSGVKTTEEYGQLFKNTFFFVMELNKQYPGKKIILGLPAYDDKTHLHQKETENLEVVLSTLKPFTPFQLKPLCAGDIKLSYYAGWTLTTKDIQIHQQIEDWKTHACEKRS